MNTFELYLLKSGDMPANPERIVEAFRAEGWIRRLRADASRFVYRNEDTGVFFQVLAAPFHAEEVREPELEPAEEASDEGDPAPAEDDPVIEMAPVTFSLPLLCPSFFGREALGVAERIAGAAGLEIGAGEHASAASDILAEWDRLNREAVIAFEDSGQLALWMPEASAAWWQYGTRRAELEAELGAAGVQVPRLQAARHDGKVKSLFIWDVGTPVVVPRSDLVLLRRTREKKGLLFTRRVTEEGLVSCERLWDILAPFSELREAPVRILIFREARKPPQQVAAQLETLVLEPVASAKRTDLLGVVDFEVPSGKEAQA